MRLAALVACVVAALLAPGARADVPAPYGMPCDLASTADPTAQGMRAAVLTGGPYVAPETAEPDRNVYVSTYLLCTVQVGGTGVYTDDDVVRAYSSTGEVEPTAVSFAATPFDGVYICTELYVSDGTDYDYLYWDTTTGFFVTDPASAHCRLAISQDLP